MRKNKEEELEKIIKRVCHEELVMQVIGLLEIEIGNALSEKNIEYSIGNGNSSIDMFIYDPDFDAEGRFATLTTLIHLHHDDLLWGILNINKLKERALEQADKYINYRKELYK